MRLVIALESNNAKRIKLNVVRYIQRNDNRILRPNEILKHYEIPQELRQSIPNAVRSTKTRFSMDSIEFSILQGSRAEKPLC